METNTLSLHDQRKRRMLLFMPFIVFSFTTLLFWTLGGGKKDETNAAKSEGLSMKLPKVIIAADQTGDKMSFYEQARADSLKKQQLRKVDPYTLSRPDSTDRLKHINPAFAFSPQVPEIADIDYGGNSANNAARINQKLMQLQQVIDKPQARPITPPVKIQPVSLPDSLLKSNPGVEDPELKQMNGLLEKILEIQHPDRTKVAAEKTQPSISVKKFRAIPAVVDGTLKIVQGTVICLKLTDSVTIGGQLFNKGQHIYGSGSLSNQRYTINIKSIHVGYNFYPVDLTVFDQTDGLEGISVPEAITGDALREGANSGVQSMDLMNFDPSMTAQLTTAGINTAKGIFSKKVRRVKGKIKDGHALLLRDNQEFKRNY